MPSLLANLRSVVPVRPLSIAEGLSLAEIQAQMLLIAAEVIEPPVPERVVTDVPRVRITREAGLPVSGASHWTAGVWSIIVNGDEPTVRQRFTMAHELKHVLDAAVTPAVLYPPVNGFGTARRTEQVCDFFAACVLMPRAWIKKAYCDERVQDANVLARRFIVSAVAMRRRLVALGLAHATQRHAAQTATRS